MRAGRGVAGMYAFLEEAGRDPGIAAAINLGAAEKFIRMTQEFGRVSLLLLPPPPLTPPDISSRRQTNNTGACEYCTKLHIVFVYISSRFRSSLVPHRRITRSRAIFISHVVSL